MSMQLGQFKAKNGNFLVSRYQNTAQIAGAIIKAIDESKPTAQILAPNFKNTDKKTSARLIFIFCKNVLPYKREGSTQTAKTINRILQDRNNGHDCKHYATITASLCKALNIPCSLRLISQTYGDSTPNHIYTVAKINGDEVILDPVLKKFDTEAKYYSKYDIKL